MKLITLNIEGDKHVERMVSFIEREHPDVLCLQEVFENTLEVLKQHGYTCTFLPMTEKVRAGEPVREGVALCTTGMMLDRLEYYYRETMFPENSPGWQELQRIGILKNGFKNGILGARVSVVGSEYLVFTTHFTWSPNGEVASAEQATSMNALLAYTARLEPHLLCGDFNIPRAHNHLYGRLLERYVDAVPARYASSLDKSLHRLGNNAEKAQLFESFMVDYIFSQSPYAVSDVRLEFGISDHAAVVGTIT